jgi:Zn-dependent protease
VCAQPAPTDTSGAPPDANRPRGPRITPIQWVGLAVLVLLVLNQMGLLRLGEGGLGLGGLQSQLPRWLALVVGITVHEFSHGLVATWFGDTVPRRAGRLTLNPLKHLDPLGTLMILVGPIGWGRPMPINPAGMRNPNLGWALSSAAGPISNIIVATVTIVAFGLTGAEIRGVNDLLLRYPYVGWLVALNVGLAVFNLVPLPPLDGFGFIFGLAPRPLKVALAPIWQIGPLALLALLFLPEILPGFPPILQDVLGTGMGYVTGLLLEVYRAI